MVPHESSKEIEGVGHPRKEISAVGFVVELDTKEGVRQKAPYPLRCRVRRTCEGKKHERVRSGLGTKKKCIRMAYNSIDSTSYSGSQRIPMPRFCAENLHGISAMQLHLKPV